MAGFLTGIAFVSAGMGVGQLVRASDDPDSLIGFVDDYCDRRPLDSVAEAAQMLWLELSRRAMH